MTKLRARNSSNNTNPSNLYNASIQFISFDPNSAQVGVSTDKTNEALVPGL